MGVTRWSEGVRGGKITTSMGRQCQHLTELDIDITSLRDGQLVDRIRVILMPIGWDN